MRPRRALARDVPSRRTLARAVFVVVVVVVVTMGCEAAGAPVARATSRAVSSAIRAALDAPCDAYARTFERESVAALRAGAVEARRVECESAGSRRETRARDETRWRRAWGG